MATPLEALTGLTHVINAMPRNAGIMDSNEFKTATNVVNYANYVGRLARVIDKTHKQYNGVYRVDEVVDSNNFSLTGESDSFIIHKSKFLFEDGVEQGQRDCVEVAPVPMLLICPACGRRHIDSHGWETKVHATHACQICGNVWRPALVPTVGVRFLPGFKNDNA